MTSKRAIERQRFRTERAHHRLGPTVRKPTPEMRHLRVAEAHVGGEVVIARWRRASFNHVILGGGAPFVDGGTAQPPG